MVGHSPYPLVGAGQVGLLLEERSVVASLDLLRDVVASLSSLFLASTAALYSRHGTKFTPVVPGAGHMHF